jgi:hypothetical protein
VRFRPYRSRFLSFLFRGTHEASCLASWNTDSIIGAVSFPVFVFCRLGW